MTNLSNLYKHWDKYSQIPEVSGKEYEIPLDSEVEQAFWSFVTERMNVWHKRTSGLPAPWSEDEVLQKVRFTNIYRELDRQTIHWHGLLKPMENDLELWFLNMMHCRLMCRPETVEYVGLLNFNEEENKARHQKFLDMLPPKTGSSYNFAQYESQLMGYQGRHDVLYLHVPKVAKACAKVFTDKKNAGVVDIVERMVPAFEGRMRFILTEIVMDAGYQWPEHVNEFDRFHIGPGAEPLCKAMNKKANPEDVALTLMKHQPFGAEGFPHLEMNGHKVVLTTAAIEQALCEYRKYLNIKADMKKSRKRLYKPGPMP